MLADVTRALANEEVSIASVIQHEALEEHEGEVVPLVIMTHLAVESAVRSALDEIDGLDVVRPPSVCLGVED